MQSGTGSLEPCSVNPAFRASQAREREREKSHAASLKHLDRAAISVEFVSVQGIDYSSQMGSRSKVATACHANAAWKVDGGVAASAAPAARRLLRRGSRLFNYPEKAAYGVCAAHYCAAAATAATASVCSPALNRAATCSLSRRERAKRPRRSVSR